MPSIIFRVAIYDTQNDLLLGWNPSLMQLCVSKGFLPEKAAAARVHAHITGDHGVYIVYINYIKLHTYIQGRLSSAGVPSFFFFEIAL